MAGQELWVDPWRGLVTLRHDLTLDRGLSYEAALRRLEHERKACALRKPNADCPGCCLGYSWELSTD